jgi:uncharacterized membrane protein YjgN (DUF898 family)
MEPAVTAAILFVAVSLLTPTIMNLVKKLWFNVLWFGLSAFSQAVLAYTADLWPFYVMSGVYTFGTLVVAIAAAVDAYIDAKKASAENVSN